MVELEKIKPIIVEKLKPLNPVKIIIFGSYGKGSATRESDLDICVVREKDTDKWKNKQEIRKALKDIKVGKDILNPTIDELEFYKKELNSVYYDVITEGIVLWERS